MKKNYLLKPIGLLYCLFIFMAILCGSCRRPYETDTRKKIITTCFPPFDFTREIVGDDASVEMLISPGAEVHTYEPTVSDLLKISKADVFIYLGGESDSWIERILSSIDTSNLKIISLVECISKDDLLEEGDELTPGEDSGTGEIEYDEHVWTSLANASVIVKKIAEVVEEVDPENQNQYEINKNAYLEKLKTLQTKFREMIDASPKKTIVVCDRFPLAYFCKEFGLDHVAAFSGCSEEGDASPTVIAALIKTVRENNLKYIFTIEFSNQKIANSVKEATNAEILTFQSGHTISKSDLESGVSYYSIMESNFVNLQKALA